MSKALKKKNDFICLVLFSFYLFCFVNVCVFFSGFHLMLSYDSLLPFLTIFFVLKVNET